jgi:hypothetical protein
MRAIAPNGSPITGTLETVSAVAEISEFSFRWNDDHTRVEFEYGGWTEVDWNGQESVVRDGGLVFVDEEGVSWPESMIVLLDVEEGA